ncbi:unnamed protein product (macronuclear) [Paramecium tetraurelia]|uniref:Uncharacterized protein n=1 Tax=Paramecium tetraurelia TaxID=5888 RepID=A0ED49_PARTE|nr:uncharacterized protein GSPATT00004085001 [Paramecium tetraurelia]CAK93216.1 unnamed protein product [Paramecium tetraurelia]|eukprot:XP_001460613.1 hypothetical protein (macronuclear) [Paramecium tetraurelia strain d4-2]
MGIETLARSTHLGDQEQQKSNAKITNNALIEQYLRYKRCSRQMINPILLSITLLYCRYNPYSEKVDKEKLTK